MDDDIKSDYSPIKFTIGEVYDTVRVERRDWKNMDWDSHTNESRIPLQCLIRDWDENEADAAAMAQQMVSVVTSVGWLVGVEFNAPLDTV